MRARMPMFALVGAITVFPAVSAHHDVTQPGSAAPGSMPGMDHSKVGQTTAIAPGADVSVTASGSQDPPARSDQQILIQLEHDWDDAFYRKDVRFIENILADEYVTTYDDGSRGDKAKELALAVEFNQQVDSSTLDEFTVKVYGDMAVVWFTQHLVGPSQGRQHKVTYRYIDVFVWRQDRWQCVATQSTKIPAA